MSSLDSTISKTGIPKAETVGPLRFRFTDDEGPSRIVGLIQNMANSYAARPVFSGTSAAEIEDFLTAEVFGLLDIHLSSSITFENDSTGWTGHTANLSVNEFDLCRDLASAAYANFVLAHASPEVQLIS